MVGAVLAFAAVAVPPIPPAGVDPSGHHHHHPVLAGIDWLVAEFGAVVEAAAATEQLNFVAGVIAVPDYPDQVREQVYQLAVGVDSPVVYLSLVADSEPVVIEP